MPNVDKSGLNPAHHCRALGFAPLPVRSGIDALLLSPRTRTVAIAHRLVSSAADRRYFGAWQEIRSRHSLYQIIKQRMKQTASRVRLAGRVEEAEHLNNATPPWLRHTFAHSALRQGHGLREVASLLGQANTDTTMIYTEQEALDLIRVIERNQRETQAQS
ncbi:tyrosine-type recombinase/integrase [Rugamonas apoptosis]|uniref:Tyrosine-type recombinase/integrase n=1 Tax=Rugamonas apoptosis TaxID=2758570 RepID=A0A7W2FFA6_9BURK|nr:tyrosine-type recombinase/integrase [Rugamonas apoptosis]MBA5690567.1 tyrosine-type recombinase/integrase [Rugamonas apoptosis]